MGTVNHSVLSQPNLHPAFNLIYRTEADRIAGTNEVNSVTLAAANIGQDAKQLDNNSRWELLTVTPSITWAQISGGQKQPTTADVDLYISTTGDDDTGDGSLSTPYATFDRALRDVQDKDIRHAVIIHPAEGNYATMPSDWDLKISPGGRLITDASDQPYPVVAGPFTISAVAGVGAADAFGTELATDLTAGTPGWSADAYYGKFIHFTSGNWAGYVLPVWKNTTDTIRTIYDWHTFANGDTFNIVDCPVTIDISHDVRISASIDSISNTQMPQLIFCGIKLKIQSMVAYDIPFYLKDISTVFSFCTLQDKWDTDAFSIPIERNNSDLNAFQVPLGLLANEKLREWFTYAFWILSMDGAVPAASGTDMLITGQDVRRDTTAMACRRKVFSNSASKLSYLLIGGYTNFAGAGPSAQSSGYEVLDHIFIEQIGFTDVGINAAARLGLEVDTVYMETVDLPMSLKDGSYALIKWLKGNTIGDAYALEINRKSHAAIPTVADVTILGTVGAVKFTFDNTTHVAWPISGAFHSKANSFVVSE